MVTPDHDQYADPHNCENAVVGALNVTKPDTETENRQRRQWPGTTYTIMPQHIDGITEELPWQNKM